MTDIDIDLDNGEADPPAEVAACDHPLEERVYSSDRASCRACGETVRSFPRLPGMTPKEHEAAIEILRHLESIDANMRALFRKWTDEATDRDAADARGESELRPIGEALDKLIRDESTTPTEKLPAIKRYAATVERLLRP